jgi:hypothetical protein
VRKDEGDALWKRFRGKCDEFFERRKKHWEERDESRAENLKKYEAMCVRAEELAKSSDWKHTADELKALQAEWKAGGPMPKEQSEAMWARFRAACDGFFERRKEHFAEADAERDANLKKKIALCEQVEALAKSEDREAAKGECKKLQAEWKKTGPAPKDQADEVWNRFRASCDEIFDRGGKRVEEPPPPPAPNAPKFENRALAEKLASLKPEPEAPPAELHKAKTELEAAADGWADLAGDLDPKSK